MDSLGKQENREIREDPERLDQLDHQELLASQEIEE